MRISGDKDMSRTIRCYNKWAKAPMHPLYPYISPCMNIELKKWWQQWRYGKSSCLRCKDDYVFIHVHNKRKRILLKKHKFEMI